MTSSRFIPRSIGALVVAGSLVLAPAVAFAETPSAAHARFGPAVASDADAPILETRLAVLPPAVGDRSLYLLGQAAPVSATLAWNQPGDDLAELPAGTVEFFDGTVSLGTQSVNVSTNTGTHTVSIETDRWPGSGGRTVTAKFTPAAGSPYASATSATRTFRLVDTKRMVDDVELTGAEVASITDASLDWTIANIWFSNFSVGFERQVLDGPVSLPELAPGETIPEKQAYYSRPFTFSAGSGARDSAGSRVISYDGSVRLTSGSANRWDFADPRVHIAANGDGYVTAEFSGFYILGDHTFPYGPTRVTIATFTGATIESDANGLVTADIELNWAGQAGGGGTWAHDYDASFPTEFVTLLHPAINLFFARSSVATDSSKIPRPITLTFSEQTVSKDPAPDPDPDPDPTPQPKPDPQPTLRPLSFADVTKGHKFFTQIEWMSQQRITTGVQTPQGLFYQPKASTTREAMAAFLYRMYAPSDYRAPTSSPFVDVLTNHKFYRQIAWMHSSGVSTGVRTSTGLTYQPKAATTREAMAAFLYRIAGDSDYRTPGASPFVDVSTSHKFYRQIAWMHSTRTSTGVRTDGGLTYQGGSHTTREAMAAFLYRLK